MTFEQRLAGEKKVRSVNIYTMFYNTEQPMQWAWGKCMSDVFKKTAWMPQWPQHNDQNKQQQKIVEGEVRETIGDKCRVGIK